MPNVPELNDAEAITDSVGMLNARCVRLIDRGKDDEAIQCYDSMMKSFGPSYALANFMKGLILIKKGKYNEAKKYILEAEKLAPGAPDVKIGLAICAVRMGETGDARGLIAEALEFAPKDPATLISASLLYYELNQAKEGANCIKKAMDINQFTAFSCWEIAANSLLENPDISQAKKKELKAAVEENRKLGENLKKLDEDLKKLEEKSKKKKK